jgi:hypothetical protein
MTDTVDRHDVRAGDPASNRYLSGNFGPVSEEVTAFDLPVIGELPVELDGRYLRNGPNPIEPVDPRPPTTGSSATAWSTASGSAAGGRVVPQPVRRFEARRPASRRARHPRPELERQPPGPQHQRRRVRRHHVGDGRGRRVPGRAHLRARDRGPQRLLRHPAGRVHRPPEGRPDTGEMHAMVYAWGQWLDHVQYVSSAPTAGFATPSTSRCRA